MNEQKNVFQSIIETIYRVTTDEQICKELEAREEELRREYAIQQAFKNHADKIAELDNTITKQNATIAEQNEKIQRLHMQIEALQKQAADI